MRTILPGLLMALSLSSQLLVAEERQPAAEPAGIFGEFTLVGGERVIGLYHPEKGVIEVFAAGKPRAVKAQDIVARRRLAPEAESEPANREAGRARLTTIAYQITDAQGDAKRLENQRSELEKQHQNWMLELSKREVGNKDAMEAMASEQDRERKATFAALSTEHLKAIATAHAEIKEIDAAIAAMDARMAAVRAHLEDLRSRSDWLGGRLQAMNAAAGGK